MFGTGSGRYAAGLPGGKRQGECGDLRAARVESPARTGCRGSPRRRPAAALSPPPPSASAAACRTRPRGSARAAAGVHDGDLADAVGPAREGAGGRGAVVAIAEIRQLARSSGLSGAGAAHQRAERVLQQEADHVVLGEELRHRGQVGAADLAPAGLLTSSFFFALPELVDPAQGIVGGEDLGRQVRSGWPRARWRPSGAKRTCDGGSSARKMPGSIARGIAGGQDPGVGSPSSAASSAHVLQR